MGTRRKHGDGGGIQLREWEGRAKSIHPSNRLQANNNNNNNMISFSLSFVRLFINKLAATVFMIQRGQRTESKKKEEEEEKKKKKTLLAVRSNNMTD